MFQCDPEEESTIASIKENYDPNGEDYMPDREEKHERAKAAEEDSRLAQS